jgi:ribosomal protein S18 acetylase RimI-like enzyme
MKEVELLPMDEGQFAAYLERAVPRYAKENVKAGYRTEEDALDRSRADHLRLLPLGTETPGNHLFIINDRESGHQIGVIWIKFEEGNNPAVYIYDVFVEEQFRGKGYGKATLRAVEAFSKAKGARSIFLHVFAHNPLAMRLYDEAGFKVRSMNMEKRLT